MIARVDWHVVGGTQGSRSCQMANEASLLAYPTYGIFDWDEKPGELPYVDHSLESVTGRVNTRHASASHQQTVGTTGRKS